MIILTRILRGPDKAVYWDISCLLFIYLFALRFTLSYSFLSKSFIRTKSILNSVPLFFANKYETASLTFSEITSSAEKYSEKFFKYFSKSVVCKTFGSILSRPKWFIPATKSANVTARVQPEIKRQAEAVLDKIGLPVSVLIDTLYRQIIMTGGVSFSLTVPKLPARDSLTDGQFHAIMEKGYNQAKSGEGLSVDEAFAKIREGIWVWGEIDRTGNRANWRNGAIYLQNPVGAGNRTKMGGHSAMWNRKAGFHAFEIPAYGGRTVAQMPVKNFLVYFSVDEKKKDVWITAVIYGRRDQIAALSDISLNDTGR